MIKKKVCMLGCYGVGKTSLVNQFVRSIFSEDYLTTIGARIDRKDLEVAGKTLSLILWDLAGEDKFEKIRGSYVRGASGYLLVFDGTRPETVPEGIRIYEENRDQLGDVPVVCVMNKSDLSAGWRVGERERKLVLSRGWPLIDASATDGESAHSVFVALGEKMLPAGDAPRRVSTAPAL